MRPGRRLLALALVALLPALGCATALSVAETPEQRLWAAWGEYNVVFDLAVDIASSPAVPLAVKEEIYVLDTFATEYFEQAEALLVQPPAPHRDAELRRLATLLRQVTASLRAQLKQQEGPA